MFAHLQRIYKHNQFVHQLANQNLNLFEASTELSHNFCLFRGHRKPSVVQNGIGTHHHHQQVPMKHEHVLSSYLNTSFVKK